MRLVAPLAFVAFLLASQSASGLERPRAVVELFTSQGCSSCPPADRLAAEWAKDPSLVALSLPVDYWDYLGWKDTLANHDFSARQRAYAAGRGDRDIYTPQAVVNGVSHCVGSDRGQIERAIRDTSVKTGVLAVPVAIAADRAGGYTVSIDRASAAGEIWVVAIETVAKVTIERGENSGTTATYANVVRAIRRVGTYGGTAQTVKLSSKDVSAAGADTFAVLVQKIDRGRLGPILGAAFQPAPAL